MTFSQRRGLHSSPSRLEPNQMTEELRASLWNALHLSLWDAPGFIRTRTGPGAMMQFARDLWYQHFKRPFSTIPRYPEAVLKALEEYFFDCDWNEVYDFLEAVFSLRKSERVNTALNTVLERELAAFRLVGGRFINVTDEQELVALNQVLRATDVYASVGVHFQRALELLSDRANPDFRNSIKESISAVEATARILTGNESATLGDALKLLEREHDLHKALKDGFSKLYGYTSDEGGIRHAMLEEPSLGIAEAKFFLLSCTSFVNYLKSRATPGA
jgi:hypothetical protein